MLAVMPAMITYFRYAAEKARVTSRRNELARVLD
jgi:hypothetical protein